MKKILLQMSSPVFANDKLFEIRDINGTTERWRALRSRLEALGYELTTADDKPLEDCERIIFIDAASLGESPNLETKLKNALRRLLRIKVSPPYPGRQLYREAVLAGLKDKLLFLIWEPQSVCPLNFSPKTLNKFDRILTWNDDQLKNPKFRKYRMPLEPAEIVKNNIPFSAKKLLVNISFNKYSSYKNELYGARRKSIAYFDSHYPDDFDLYGLRWNKPVTKLQLLFPFSVKKYSTYRGHTKDKIDTLSHYKFNLCYENISDAPGFVSEKIFDSLTAEIIPIYLGAPNITDYVDADAFIDRRRFKTDEELASFLKQMTEEEYNKHIDAGKRFMKSEKYAKFLNENFCSTVIDALNLKPLA